MRVEMTPDGPLVSALDLGPLLGLDPPEVPRLLREGIVTARHEAGVDEHAGRFRLVFLYGDVKVRLTCRDDGEVVSTVRISAGGRPEEARPGPEPGLAGEPRQRLSASRRRTAASERP